MLRKLAFYPRQNRLALALREMGRIERTLFTLEWLQSPELRRRATAGLNKGEAKHTLKRAVFFNRLGELRVGAARLRHRITGTENIESLATIIRNNTAPNLLGWSWQTE